jgi:hypothetical protein
MGSRGAGGGSGGGSVSVGSPQKSGRVPRPRSAAGRRRTAGGGCGSAIISIDVSLRVAGIPDRDIRVTGNLIMIPAAAASARRSRAAVTVGDLTLSPATAAAGPLPNIITVAVT